MKSLLRVEASVLFLGWLSGLAFGGAMDKDNFMIGNSTITSPAGWTQIEKEEERIVLRAPDGRQQATISIMRFGVDPSFEDFKKLCELRITAEKQPGDCVVQSEVPFANSEEFGMHFSGEEKKMNRVFSGYLTLCKRELLTVYLEGLGAAPKEHLDTFKFIVASIKRR